MKNKAVFIEAYNLYYESLCFFACRYLGDSYQAEDVIGDLFAKLWQKDMTFNDEEHLKAYLYRSAFNACYTYSKSVKSLKAREDLYYQQSTYSEQDFLHNMIRAELNREVHRAIDKLPSQCSLVIKMSYLEGLKNPEIAEKLGLSLQTVKNYKHRGLSLLKGVVPKESYTL